MPLIDAAYAASDRSGENAVFSSPTWPSHRRPIVAANRPATSVPSDAANSDARASKKSPERIATRLPHFALTDGTPRRVSASSITSSWYSEPIWTSSTEMPPVNHVVGNDATARCGRDRGQHRPQTLSAGADQVTGDLGQIRVFGDNRFAKLILQPRHCIGEPGKIQGGQDVDHLTNNATWCFAVVDNPDAS